MFYFTFANPYIIYTSVVFLFVFAVYAIFQKQEFIHTHKRTILWIVTILLVWSQLARYGFSVIRDGGFSNDYLPFYVCRISSLVLLYYVITKDKRVESFLFYWAATGLAGVTYPNGEINNIPNLTETFYIDHFLLALTPFYLVVYEGFRPSKKNLFQVTALMLVVLLTFIPLNNIFGTDYFYTKDQSIFGIIFPFIPDTVFGVNIALSSIAFAFGQSLFSLGYFFIYYNYFKNLEYRQVPS